MRVTLIINAAFHAVDPAEAEEFIQRLLIGRAALAGVLLVESKQQLRGRGVVLGQPAAQIGGGLEMGDFHGLRVLAAAGCRFFGCGVTPMRGSRRAANLTSRTADCSNLSADSGR
jgi:hypothetical protein